MNNTNHSFSENKQIVNNDYRPKFHFSAPTGWINDPNGFSFFQGKYHLFYQYSPYDTKQAEMHWGHAISDDLIQWEHQPIALSPDADYDKDGCWSGSAIVKDGRLYLLYTGVAKNSDGTLKQTQNLAFSTDGVLFNKYEGNPVITNDNIADWTSKVDFRDPYIIECGQGDYLILIGTHSDHDAMLVSYKTKDFIHYQFHKTIARSNKNGSMYECPTFFQDTDHDVLVISPQDKLPELNSFWNVSSSMYTLLDKHSICDNSHVGEFHEIDHGLDFYAPQILNDGHQSIMIAWMYMWGRRYYLDEIRHHWIHNLTLPRTVSVRDNKLIQQPISSIYRYFKNPLNITTKIDQLTEIEHFSGATFNLQVSIPYTRDLVFEVMLQADEKHHSLIKYDAKENILIIDRRNSGVHLVGLEREKSHHGYRQVEVFPKEGLIKLNIFIDVIAIEVFVNDGEETLSMISFAKGQKILFRSSTPIDVSILIHEIVIESNQTVK